MIADVIWPEKNGVSYEFDLPVMVIDNRNPNHVVVLTAFNQDNDGNFAYHGYYVGNNGCTFTSRTIYDEEIENWSKFSGKVVLSNFAENE